MQFRDVQPFLAIAQTHGANPLLYKSVHSFFETPHGNKKLLVTKGITTRSKDATSSSWPKRASLLGARTLLLAPGLTLHTRSFLRSRSAVLSAGFARGPRG